MAHLFSHHSPHHSPHCIFFHRSTDTSPWGSALAWRFCQGWGHVSPRRSRNHWPDQCSPYLVCGGNHKLSKETKTHRQTGKEMDTHGGRHSAHSLNRRLDRQVDRKSKLGQFEVKNHMQRFHFIPLSFELHCDKTELLHCKNTTSATLQPATVNPLNGEHISKLPYFARSRLEIKLVIYNRML